MKHVVVQSDLQEADIRPPELLSRFRELSIEDSARFFAESADRVAVACPACGIDAAETAFSRQTFDYRQCSACESLFVSPRPSPDRLADYYAGSRAVSYRAEHLMRATSEARRSLLRANANWMGRLLDENGGSRSRAYGDIGTNFPVLFEEVAALGLFDRCFAIDPLPELAAACSAAGATVVSQPVEPLAALTLFEQLEHQFSPLATLRAGHALLAPGGMIFITTRTIMGFDLLTLWDKTPYIFVPEHLNLLSLAGLSLLFEAAGFEIIELSTPGQLDVELTRMAAAADPSIELPRFLAKLLARRPEAHEEFQAFLQKHRLSSHVRIAARRK